MRVQHFIHNDQGGAGHAGVDASRSVQAIVRDLIVNGSIEIRNDFSESVRQAREDLPYGMRIYIRSLHDQTVAASLDRLRALHASGFDPVPHVAARRIRSRGELKEFLETSVRECGVTRVLLIGGDIPEPLGPYRDAGSVLVDGVLEAAGIREVGLAGYPEGHARIPRDRLQPILRHKLQLAAHRGLGAYVVTQFSFVPARVVDFCAMLSRDAPEAAVYVGVAGPTAPEKLAAYAKLCGVSPSIRALTVQGFQTPRLVSHTEPEAQLDAVARYCAARAACNVAGVHIYGFGGFITSSQWMRRLYSN
jgi:methylenetetrahydrofolate reductase (NADPH)